jgi:hypothetical protein
MVFLILKEKELGLHHLWWSETGFVLYHHPLCFFCFLVIGLVYLSSPNQLNFSLSLIPVLQLAFVGAGNMFFSEFVCVRVFSFFCMAFVSGRVLYGLLLVSGRPEVNLCR